MSLYWWNIRYNEKKINLGYPEFLPLKKDNLLKPFKVFVVVVVVVVLFFGVFILLSFQNKPVLAMD